jgi:hypothetical protein
VTPLAIEAWGGDGRRCDEVVGAPPRSWVAGRRQVGPEGAALRVLSEGREG